MKTKWIKIFVLIVLVIVLLTTAVAISPKIGETTNVEPGDTQPAATQWNPFDPSVEPTQSQPDSGWVVEFGKNRYYVNGVLQKDTIVGDETNGYYYVNASGDRDDGYCNGLTINGTKWNVIEGKATQVKDEWDEALHCACLDIGKCTDSSMTRDEKLRAAFEYIKDDNHYLEGVLHDPPYRELDWPVVCANDLFKEGMGDCFSYGAAFAFYGKACGFENCYACNSGGHGWSEINGKAYDPEWDMHHQEYNHFGVSPGDDCDVAYFTSLTDGVDWMYMKV